MIERDRKPEKTRIVWLSVSPSLRPFDKPLLHYLARTVEVARWDYSQTLDEASWLDQAVDLLYEYLQTYDRPIDLVGHGLSGVVGLLGARRFPERVRSLSLLAVSAQPAVTWQAHYYVQRQSLPCSQRQILVQTVRSLFGRRLPASVDRLVTVFERDLIESPSPHSLFHVHSLPQGGVPMPLLVCGSQTDPVVSPPDLQSWSTWIKPNTVDSCMPPDRLWTSTSGSHFFHYFYPSQIGQELLQFWRVQPIKNT
jgi:pimeloyl-ACP methyl ester carboxylesterase